MVASVLGKSAFLEQGFTIGVAESHLMDVLELGTVRPIVSASPGPRIRNNVGLRRKNVGASSRRNNPDMESSLKSQYATRQARNRMET